MTSMHASHHHLTQFDITPSDQMSCFFHQLGWNRAWLWPDGSSLCYVRSLSLPHHSLALHNQTQSRRKIRRYDTRRVFNSCDSWSWKCCSSQSKFGPRISKGWFMDHQKYHINFNSISTVFVKGYFKVSTCLIPRCGRTQGVAEHSSF